MVTHIKGKEDFLGQIDEWVMPTNTILVQLAKYPEDTTEPGTKLTVEKYEVFHTQGGNEKAKIDRDYEWSGIGTIIKVGERCKIDLKESPEVLDKLKPGATVVLNRNVVHGRNQFLPNTVDKVVPFDGLLEIHPNQVSLIR